ncbi:MAG: hypothetical protein HGA45_38080, partial [Chloroflexales bacterium]|nr:hypothetical protein [Chloroflexales bacterium]
MSRMPDQLDDDSQAEHAEGAASTPPPLPANSALLMEQIAAYLAQKEHRTLPTSLPTAEAVSRFLAHRTGKNLTDESLRLYRYKLKFWNGWRETQQCPRNVDAITLDELDRFFTYLATEHVPHVDNPRRPPEARRGLSPETVASYRRVLRAFWTF